MLQLLARMRTIHVCLSHIHNQKIFGSYSTAAGCKVILQFAISSKSYFVMDEAYKLGISSKGLSGGFLFHEPAESQ